jgi:hypothetical protein
VATATVGDSGLALCHLSHRGRPSGTRCKGGQWHFRRISHPEHIQSHPHGFPNNPASRPRSGVVHFNLPHCHDSQYRDQHRFPHYCTVREPHLPIIVIILSAGAWQQRQELPQLRRLIQTVYVRVKSFCVDTFVVDSLPSLWPL